MHAFFKPVVFLLAVALIFFYVLINSNTIETTTALTTSRTGMPLQTTSYTYHWDRFGAYISNTPERIKKYFSGAN